MNRVLLTIPLLMALGGCGETRPAAPEPPAAAPSAQGASGPAPLDSAPEPAAAPGDSVVLALEGDGLRTVVVSSGSARPVPFGTPSDQALRILVAVHGAPPRDQGESADCGAAYATWESGLTVWFSRSRFVGWSVRGGALTTVSGVGVGSTRDALEAVYDVRVTRSTLGVEFVTGGLAGLLDAPGGEARVVTLWAGATCLAR